MVQKRNPTRQPRSGLIVSLFPAMSSRFFLGKESSLSLSREPLKCIHCLGFIYEIRNKAAMMLSFKGTLRLTMTPREASNDDDEGHHSIRSHQSRTANCTPYLPLTCAAYVPRTSYVTKGYEDMCTVEMVYHPPDVSNSYTVALSKYVDCRISLEYN